MSTELTSAPAPERQRSSARSKTGRRIVLAVCVLVVVGLVTGGLVIFGWMVDETHFDRPSAEFDQFAADIDGLPGVGSVETERWVEAPTFSDPTSWMSVSVEESGLPGLLEAACTTDYPDGVTWSIRVLTPSATEVSLHASPPPDASLGSRCPDFGFDAVALVDELDRVAPGLAVQPSIWQPGRLTFVEVEEALPVGFTHLLPLIENADTLLSAAGLAADDVVEINAATLDLRLRHGEADEYLALLRELADDRGVSTFWASDSSMQTDGVAKVQMVAPQPQRTSIEEAVASSGLPIADYRVRFIEQ